MMRCDTELLRSEVTYSPAKEGYRLVSIRVALCGKGGVGKTALATMLCGVLARAGRRVLACDFDVNPGLDHSLGSLDANGRLPSQAVLEQPGSQYGFALHPELSASEAVQRFAARCGEGIRLLSLGAIGSAHHDLAITHYAVRQVAASFDEPGWDVVVDMEAGTKDLYDGSYIAFVDLAVLVTDGSPIADLTCRRLAAIARAQQRPPAGLVLNRADAVRTEQARQLARDLDVPFLGAVPEDDAVRQADVAVAPLAPHGATAAAVGVLAQRLREQCARAATQPPVRRQQGERS